MTECRSLTNSGSAQGRERAAERSRAKRGRRTRGKKNREEGAAAATSTRDTSLERKPATLTHPTATKTDSSRENKTPRADAQHTARRIRNAAGGEAAGRKKKKGIADSDRGSTSPTSPARANTSESDTRPTPDRPTETATATQTEFSARRPSPRSGQPHDPGGKPPYDRHESRRLLPAARVPFRVPRTDTEPAGGRRLLGARAGRSRCDRHDPRLPGRASNDGSADRRGVRRLTAPRPNRQAAPVRAVRDFPSTGSSPSPIPVSRSTAIRLKTATAASPSMQPATALHRSPAPTRRSSSTICFPD